MRFLRVLVYSSVKEESKDANGQKREKRGKTDEERETGSWRKADRRKREGQSVASTFQ